MKSHSEFIDVHIHTITVSTPINKIDTQKKTDLYTLHNNRNLLFPFISLAILLVLRNINMPKATVHIGKSTNLYIDMHKSIQNILLQIMVLSYKRLDGF